jgi:polyisoprenoid-binding protein YceI
MEAEMSAVRIIDGRPVPVAGTWKVDHIHSDIRITARHLMVAKVRGTFEDFDAAIVVGEDPVDSTVKIEAKASSVTTGTTDRDNHLRSSDFLDAEQFPLVTFESTSLKPSGENWKLTGDLTIRGVTKPVTFDLVFEGAATDPYGNTKAGFSALGEIERRDWGLTWNVPLENGGMLVSEKFQIEFDIEADLQT